MPFRSFIGSELFETGYFTNQVTHWTAVRVGEDDNPARTYSLMAYLSPMPAASAGTMQFTFFMLELDVESGHEVSIWDGRGTKGVIPSPNDRHRCLNLIRSSLGTLLEEAQPTHVFMQACDANLPPRACQKYERLLETFSAMGYIAEEQAPHHGRRSWWMERLDS